MNHRAWQHERLVDGAIHALGVGLSVAAALVLFHAVLETDDARTIVAAIVYGAGLIATFGFSAAYNLSAHAELRELLRRFDHAAIFIMIAGSYTPFALVSLRGSLGYSLLVAVWLIASVGVMLKILRPRRFERVFVAVYLALGWIGLPALGAIVSALPNSALVFLGAGAFLYTTGVVFHLWRSLPLHNAIWHGFVLMAASCHYVAVLEALALT